MHSLTWDKKQSDKKMLQQFVKVALSAVEIVGHNGDKFDLPWIRTRCLLHRIPMPPNFVTTDTLKVARSKFRFNSNRLNYISQFIGKGQKISTNFGLWKKIVLDNCTASLEKMVKYCKKDVKLLEEVYAEMSVHIPHKVHYGVLAGTSRGECPSCGSDELRKSVKRSTATGLIKQQYQCKTCGKYHTRSEK
jgi:uncharacterized protein YprB with RNaseH-like and TPR domain